MDKKGSVAFVITAAALLVLVGIGFVVFEKQATITAKTTYSDIECYVLYGDSMTSIKLDDCCANIRKSSECKQYKDDLYICRGTIDTVAEKGILQSCTT
jgi:hypothetical protein